MNCSFYVINSSFQCGISYYTSEPAKDLYLFTDCKADTYDHFKSLGLLPVNKSISVRKELVITEQELILLR